MATASDKHTPNEVERAKWEMYRDDCPKGLQPGNPYRVGNEYGKAGARFPMMLRKANRIPPGLPGAGKYAVAIPEPKRFGFRDEDDWNAARQAAADFTKDCQTIVHSEDQLLLHKGQGWRETEKEALDLAEGNRINRGDEAHLRNQGEANMSERAIAERDAAEKEHFGHLPEIPQKPIVRRVKKASKNAAV